MELFFDMRYSSGREDQSFVDKRSGGLDCMCLNPSTSVVRRHGARLGAASKGIESFSRYPTRHDWASRGLDYEEESALFAKQNDCQAFQMRKK